MKLTLAERLILRNQLTLMKAAKVPTISSSDCDELIEIVESGYEVFYDDLLLGMRENGTSSAVTAEVFDILDMYRALDSAKRNGLTVSGSYATFQGFDGNNDPHCGFARFLLDVQGKYPESAPSKNSHSSATISAYRRMVSTWKSLGSIHALSQSDVDAILK